MIHHKCSEKSIFLQAAEIVSPADRSSYLDQACFGDHNLRADVEKLLAEHERAQPLLDASTIVDKPQASKFAEGTMVGPYKLRQQIGEGGMGVVYMADQLEPVRRQVALKIIKPGMDSVQIVSRFEAERQALALMDHPNIARVLDAGTIESGHPYFAMDLVNGLPITKYCDKNQLSITERLKLFRQVCEAIQHAHQKGIIHRDIKPSNVLITLCNEKPVPKVIDFGISKAMQHPLTEKTLLTGFGQFLGTAEYMSPEQAKLNPLDVDTRSDIYSLGVLLYEMLTGSTPFAEEDLRVDGLETMLRTIRETEPPRPSTRIHESAKQSASYRRRVETSQLYRIVTGDLDWITMKALEKERSQRYSTANELADDIARYLVDEPTLARPPSSLYRFRKFVRRNRGLVISSGTILAILVISVCVSLLLASRARTASLEAESARRISDQRYYDSVIDRMKLLHAAREPGYGPKLFELLTDAIAVQDVRHDVKSVRQVVMNTLSDIQSLVPTEIGVRDSVITQVAVNEWCATTNSNGVLSLHDVATAKTIDSTTLGGAALDIWFESPRQLSVIVRDERNRIEMFKWKLTNLGELQAAEKVENDRSSRVFRFFDEEWGKRYGGAIQSWDFRGDHVAYTVGDRLIFETADQAKFMVDPGLGGNCFVRLSSDDRLAAYGADQGFSVYWIDLERKVVRHRMGRKTGTVTDLAFSNDSRQLAVARRNGVINIYSIDCSRLITSFHVGRDDDSRKIKFSNDDSRLVVLDRGRERALIWDFRQARKSLQPFPRHRGGVSAVSFASDGQFIATCGKDKCVNVCTINGNLIATIQGFPGFVQSIDFSPDQRWLAAAIWAKPTGWIIDFRDLQQRAKESDKIQLEDLKTRTIESKCGNRIAFSFDGRFCLFAGDGGVRVWNTQDWTEESIADLDVFGPNHFAAFRREDATFVALTNKKKFAAYNIPDRQFLQFSNPGIRGSNWHGIAASNLSFYFVSPKGELLRWIPTIGNEAKQVAPELFRGVLAASPNDSRIAIQADPVTISIVHVANGAVEYNLPKFPAATWSMSWSDDSQKLAVGTEDGGVFVWDCRANVGQLRELGLAR